MAGEYVYNLQNLTKQHNKTTVLDDVTLAFFFGAKIGIIGGNGSGKSSLLRIMAGVDKDYMGQVLIAKRAKIGYLEQEPQLDNTKTVLENVMLGVAEAQAVMQRYDEICDLLGTGPGAWIITLKWPWMPFVCRAEIPPSINSPAENAVA